MNAEHCVLCNAVIPEGRQVCPICERKVEQTGAAPTGYITTGDISNMCELRGQQIAQLMKDWGTQIGERTYMKFAIFDNLRAADVLKKYLRYPTYSDRMRYKRRWKA